MKREFDIRVLSSKGDLLTLWFLCRTTLQQQQQQNTQYEKENLKVEQRVI